MLQPCRILIALALTFALLPLAALGQEKGAGARPIPRESLRYDGKPFEYWRSYWQTELKAERRIECLRAMGSFGTNGYGPEAAAEIVALIRSYPDNAFGDGDVYPLLLRRDAARLEPDAKVYLEAAIALGKIGAPAVPALLAESGKSNVRNLTHCFLADLRPVPKASIPVEAIPKLVKMTLAEDADGRALALSVFYSLAGVEPKLGKSLAEELAKERLEKRFLEVVLGNVSIPYHSANDLLNGLAPHSTAVAPTLIAELRELKKLREKSAAEEKDWYLSHGYDEEDWRSKLPTFKSESRTTSIAIVNVLGNIGPGARDALPELRDALNDPSVALQEAAKTAIERITKDSK